MSFVMQETVSGNMSEEKMAGPSEAERLRMSLEEVSSYSYSIASLVPRPSSLV